MKIQIAVIEHRHGFDVYASKSWAGIMKQAAEFCRYRQTEIQSYHPEPPAGDDESDVKAYFEENEAERITTHEVELED